MYQITNPARARRLAGQCPHITDTGDTDNRGYNPLTGEATPKTALHLGKDYYGESVTGREPTGGAQ
jgi:hypothetical protein